MKKSSFTILIAVLFLMKGLAQQVQEQQRTLLTKRTADWCPYCGTWGWTYFENAIEQNGGKAVYMAAHYDGGLYDKAAKEITDNWGGFYQPKFFVNEKEQGVTSGNVAAKLVSLKTQLDSLANLAPVANCGFEPVFENGEIKVNAKVKFFQEATGEFYVGIYLLEDHVTAYQASIGANAVHRHLFRKSFTEETFGQSVTDSPVAAGTEFALNFSTSVDEITGHEYEIVGIVWRKDGDKYIPVNVWSTSQIETVSAVADPNLQNRMVVYPSVAKDMVSIQIESIDNQSVAQLEVFDANGRKVAVLLDGQLNAGASSLQLDKKELGGNGLYFLRLQTPDFVKMEKLVFVD